ncbi:hypothetical protein DVDV_2154 [Desulfovibrio sp. DV]|nr:hypothetical protein DVDV_2154 [Desulfovibrio sp. DV]
MAALGTSGHCRRHRSLGIGQFPEKTALGTSDAHHVPSQNVPVLPPGANLQASV